MNITDPSIVAAYLVAGIATAVRWHRSRSSGEPASASAAWLLVSLALGALAIARSGSAEALGRKLRGMAYTEGWYDQRWLVQVVAVAAIASLAVLIVVAVVFWTRLDGRATIQIAGAVALLGLGAGRVVSLHELDAILLRRPAGVTTLAHALEWGITAGLTINALTAPPHVADGSDGAEATGELGGGRIGDRP